MSSPQLRLQVRQFFLLFDHQRQSKLVESGNRRRGRGRGGRFVDSIELVEGKTNIEVGSWRDEESSSHQLDDLVTIELQIKVGVEVFEDLQIEIVIGDDDSRHSLDQYIRLEDRRHSDSRDDNALRTLVL